MANNFKMVAKTMFGFESILAKELQQLGATHIEEGLRMVSFEGDTGFMYKANLALRTAIKILKPIYSFTSELIDYGVFCFLSYKLGMIKVFRMDRSING